MDLRTGSSPRVRGAAHVAGIGGAERGIIPARAGSSAHMRGFHTDYGDHPRACGEQSRVAYPLSTIQGSSPRVRGAVITLLGMSLNNGIIPARAGSSFLVRCHYCSLRDHPRACGEQRPSRLPIMASSGSSPRVRGAGPLSSLALPPGWDHPRACGEQAFDGNLGYQPSGSSPRVRGAAWYGDVNDLPVGIIPARAGSRACTRTATRSSRDHPRACGEQSG